MSTAKLCWENGSAPAQGLTYPTESEYRSWKQILELYLVSAEVAEKDKLSVLLEHKNYSSLEDCTTYKEVTLILENKLSLTGSQAIHRYKLQMRKQKDNETAEQYFIAFKKMSKEKF